MSIYRIVQESINNVLKHSGATELKVALETTGENVRLEIHDNGKGFDARAIGDGERVGFGLLGIAERVRLSGNSHHPQPPGRRNNYYHRNKSR